MMGHVDVETFFSRMIDAPAPESIRQALEGLKSMGILEETVC
jgi:hypothetical protein